MHIHDERCFRVHAQHLTLVPMVVAFLLKSTWQLVLLGHNFFSAPPWPPISTISFLMVFSHSLLEPESNKVGSPNKGGTSKRRALTNEKG